MWNSPTAAWPWKERADFLGDFEQELNKLSEIAQRLQSGQEGIEKSMALYTQGISLADALQKKLDAYKTQIEILKTDADINAYPDDHEDE